MYVLYIFFSTSKSEKKAPDLHRGFDLEVLVGSPQRFVVFSLLLIEAFIFTEPEVNTSMVNVRPVLVYVYLNIYIYVYTCKYTL